MQSKLFLRDPLTPRLTYFLNELALIDVIVNILKLLFYLFIFIYLILFVACYEYVKPIN